MNSAPHTLSRLMSATGSKSLLRFLTCGSVDDGKSTLIGRLLHDTKRIHDDQWQTLNADSRRFGTTGDEPDLALLVDGLQAEREQGITIDVAYRYFSTPKRSFIVADTPGHEQYTRNMATGASTSDLAIILVDARKGLLTQTRRHATIVSLLGIRHVVLAVNKIDLVNDNEDVFGLIKADFIDFAASLAFDDIVAIPLSARFGDNVIETSKAMSWYQGPSLLQHLETVEVEQTAVSGPLRFPVQYVNRPHADFRGYCGTLASGTLRTGDEVVIARTGQTSQVRRIITVQGDQAQAVAGDAITLTFAHDIDLSRGDVLCKVDQLPEVSDQFAAHLIWMHEEAMVPGRQYLMKLGAQVVPATITQLKHRLDVNTLEHHASRTLSLNEIGHVNMATAHAIVFDPYTQNRATGGFILIDRFTNQTVGAGMIEFGLRRASNLTWQHLDVTKEARAKQKHQKPAVLWFTGLSGSGKSTLANLVEKRLHALGVHTYLLDGDNVRHGLNKDLGFTEADRVENIRRVAEVARLFVDAGLMVLVSFISPFRSEREMARGLMEEGEFIEVFVDAPLEVCEARDPKGLYAKAREGLIANFTGIDQPYEAPDNPDVRLETASEEAEPLVEKVIAHLRRQGYIL